LFIPLLYSSFIVGRKNFKATLIPASLSHTYFDFSIHFMDVHAVAAISTPSDAMHHYFIFTNKSFFAEPGGIEEVVYTTDMILTG